MIAQTNNRHMMHTVVSVLPGAVCFAQEPHNIQMDVNALLLCKSCAATLLNFDPKSAIWKLCAMPICWIMGGLRNLNAKDCIKAAQQMERAPRAISALDRLQPHGSESALHKLT